MTPLKKIDTTREKASELKDKQQKVISPFLSIYQYIYTSSLFIKNDE